MNNIIVKLITIAALILPVSINAETYYLDAASGDDGGDGTIASPWKTISKAQSTVVSGDTVILYAGDYGNYTESNHSARTNWVTYRANTGADVHLDYVAITNSSLTESYLAFDGIKIKPDLGTTICGPQDSVIGVNSCTKTARPVEVTYSSHIKILNSDLEGANKYLTTAGVRLYYTDNIEITHNKIHEVTIGVQIEHAANTTINRNHIYRTVASGINQGSGGDSGTIVSYNNIHDSHYNEADDYCVRPDAPDAYHGSGVAIRSSDTSVIGNIIHDGYPSGGIYTYTDTTHYDDIIINGNLLYDLSTNVIIQLLYIGDNCEVKNNTIIGYYYTSPGVNRLTIGLLLYSVDSDGSPSIDVYNNIMASRMGVATEAMAILSEDNNIFYAYQDDIAVRCDGADEVGGNSTVQTCTSAEPISYFTDGTLFNGVIDVSVGNGLTQDFSISTGSDAVNFGDPAHQYAKGMGSLDSNGFILDNGTTRSSSLHSAGAYEVVTARRFQARLAGD